MCTASWFAEKAGGFPAQDYGQPAGKAFNPDTRDPVYQQVSKARGDASFATGMALDILLGKDMSYDRTGFVETKTNNRTNVTMTNDYTNSFKKTGISTEGKIAMNKYASWVPQAFTGAMRGDDGNWYTARALTRENGAESPAWTFRAADRITDANLVNQLNGGHYAFKAAGADGAEVYMAWADGYVPGKGSSQAKAGQAEAGNVKGQSTSSGRSQVTVGMARPGNIIGGSAAQAATLLGDSEDQAKRKTLLGGTSQ